MNTQTQRPLAVYPLYACPVSGGACGASVSGDLFPQNRLTHGLTHGLTRSF